MKIRRIIEQHDDDFDYDAYADSLRDEQDGEIFNVDENDIFVRAEKGDVSILDEPGIENELNEYGDSPVHELAAARDVNEDPIKAQKLLKSKHINLRNSIGWSPLHIMAQYKPQSKDVSKMIAKHPNAVLSTDDRWKETVLHIMAMSGKKTVFINSSTFTIKNSHGKTPYDLWIGNPRRGSSITIADIVRMIDDDNQ